MLFPSDATIFSCRFRAHFVPDERLSIRKLVARGRERFSAPALKGSNVTSIRQYPIPYRSTYYLKTQRGLTVAPYLHTRMSRWTRQFLYWWCYSRLVPGYLSGRGRRKRSGILIRSLLSLSPSIQLSTREDIHKCSASLNVTPFVLSLQVSNNEEIIDSLVIVLNSLVFVLLNIMKLVHHFVDRYNRLSNNRNLFPRSVEWSSSCRPPRIPFCQVWLPSFCYCWSIRSLLAKPGPYSLDPALIK